MVLINVLWGGLAQYPSDVLPRSGEVGRFGDQVQQCLDAAKPFGVEVHVWKVNFNLGNAPQELLDRLRREGRTQVSDQGKPLDWLCPSHPDNRELERAAMLEVVGKYPIDGLHFDYIRYPSKEYCYCDGCRRRFEAQSGRSVVDWPTECRTGARKEEYNEWRVQQITSLVRVVSGEAKKIRPGLKISAAVYPSYPSCRDAVAQDWVEWIKSGWLDFVCPMNYSANDETFASQVRSQLKLIGGRAPLYPGIGASATGISLTPDRVVGQVHLARALGAAGFAIFNFEPDTAESVIPAFGLGAGATKAVPPHRDFHSDRR